MSKGAFLRTVPVAFLALAASRVIAADPLPSLTESDYFDDMPAVLSASRLSQSREDAPVATTIIDREMIEASGARNLADLLRLVPGTVVAYPTGFAPFVSHHGLSDDNARRMQVLVDGREVYQPSTGGVPWAALPVALSDIERVEVVRGPNAATYGANSYLGVISITTLHTRATTGEELHVNAGSHDIRDVTLRAGGGDGSLLYRVTAGRRGDDGLSGLNDSSKFPFLSARADWEASQSDEVALYFGYSGGELDLGSGAKPTDPMREANTINRYGQIHWRHDLGDGHFTEVRLYHSTEEYDESFSIDFAPLVIPTNKDFSTERFDGEAQYTAQLTGTLRAVAGAGYRMDRGRSQAFFGSDAPLTNQLSRIFAHGEWTIRPDLVLNAGAMWETSTITDSDFSPRLSLNWHLDAGHTVRVGASGAVRTPVLFEELGDWKICVDAAGTICDQIILASGGLDSEKIESFEIGHLARWHDTLHTDLRIYRDRLTKLISNVKLASFPGSICVPGATPDLSRDFDCDHRDFHTTDTVRAQGAEFEADWRPRPGTRLRTTYALADLKSDNVGGYYSLSAPRHQIGLLGSQDLPWRLRASAAYYSQSSFAYLGEDPIPHIRRLDVKFARAIDIPGAEGEVALTGQSVLGQYPDGLEDSTGYDSRVFASIGLRFDN